ncbi:MAG: ECF transporter S component [Oscillospiraceae bacterium]|nr:ECF transporter S component [Oscillospiraceae bacterium]
MKNENLKRIIIAAVFSAIAFLLTFVFKFKVMFLTFDFKDAVIAVVSLALGPLYGVASAALVAFLEFLSISDTGPYGLLMNFISSGTFAFVIGSIYKQKRTFSGAILSASVSALSVTAIMMVANYFITPLYMGVSSADVAKMIPTLLLPFNLAKTVINAASTLIIYKPVTKALRRVGLMKKTETQQSSNKLKTVVLYIVSLAVIILTVLFIFFVLNGGFELVS